MSELTEEIESLLPENVLDVDASSSGDEFETVFSAKKKKPKPPIGKLSDLFRYATCWDNVLYITGALFACIQGAGWPVIGLVFGDMTDSFISPKNHTNTCSLHTDDVSDQITTIAVDYTFIATVVFIGCYFQIACFVTACEHQTYRLRKKLFESILRQDIAWFDERQSGELTSSLANDLDRVKEGIGDKLSMVIQCVGTVVAGFGIGFWKCWQMTLVTMSMTPLLAICGFFAAKFMSSYAQREAEQYAKAGCVAEEVFSCIKTVVSFRGQRKETRRYSEKAQDSEKLGIRRVLVSSLGFGLHYFILYATYTVSFYYGSIMVADGYMSAGDVFTVFACVYCGSYALGSIAPNLNQLTTAKAAAGKIFQIIDRVPTIDASNPFGERKSTILGNICLRNINFRYPSRPNVQILNDFCLSVRSGQTVALVGSSGCGKSTVVNLIQRFYDPYDGQVLLDGADVNTLNIKWLRQQIGVVSQEPILFGCSIAENIKYGSQHVTMAQIKEAAMTANAHDFIMSLPRGYETLVGERGAQLSGGQKQRVAIARALVRNPKILLLDEATSALDRESERSVQRALDKAREGRTTIIIAHRLSTIKNVDMIYVIDHGEVVETGHHDDLMDKKGHYHKLVTLQKLADKEGMLYVSSAALSTTHRSIRRSMVRSSFHQTSVARFSLPMQSSAGYYEGPNEGLETYEFIEAEDVEEDEPVREAGYCEIFALNKPETCYIIIGCIASLVMGATMPLFSILFSELVRVFTLPKEEMLKDALFWSLSFLGLACSSGLSQFLMQAMFGISGEKLTTRLREKTFASYVQQDISWFDDPNHSTGALTTRLASDAPMVQSATGSRLGLVLQGVCSIVVGITVAMVYGWQLALAMSACTPIFILAGVLQIKMMLLNQKRDTELLESAGKTASEAIENMRTIQSLTKEQMFCTKYCDQLKEPHRGNLKQAHIYGLAYAFSQSFFFYMFAGGFRFGAYLVDEGAMTGTNVYRVFFAVAFSGTIVGQLASYLPDYSRAKHAASLILKIMNSHPSIDSLSDLGSRPSECFGEITFKQVVFSYVNRQSVKVLKGLSMSVTPGQTVALVGPSGAGKSTVISLLQRFYDPELGEIMLDGDNIRSLNVNWLRSQIGVVGQEPVLFARSIRDNLSYGIEGNITDYDVMEAAKIANIHDFIISLPDGYDTLVGEKGTQLSGGQKQRMAIARALICNPKILLLDEATSALDTESEKSVQAALDRAREGRSCIVIAHRLSTIQNADEIVVIDNGIAVESGTHQQLMAKRGAYFALTSDKRFTGR